MAHEVETAVYANRAAWHGMGIVFDEAELGTLTAERALELGGLDWEVKLHPLSARVYAGGKEKKVSIPGHFANIRQSDNKVLGVVGHQYRVVQSKEGLGFISDLVDSDDIRIESAMSLRGGKRVAILAKRPDHITIAGEEHIPYILFATGHDGKMGVVMMATPVRVVCMNTLSMTLNTNTPHRHHVHHTPGVHGRIQTARESLGVSFKYTETLQRVGEEMAATKLSDRDFEKFLESLVPTTKNGETLEGRSLTMREDRQWEIRSIYNTEDNLNNIRGTKWGAFNAVAEWVDHRKNFNSPDRKLEAITAGADEKQKALAILRG